MGDARGMEGEEVVRTGAQLPQNIQKEKNEEYFKKLLKNTSYGPFVNSCWWSYCVCVSSRVSAQGCCFLFLFFLLAPPSLREVPAGSGGGSSSCSGGITSTRREQSENDKKQIKKNYSPPAEVVLGLSRGILADYSKLVRFSSGPVVRLSVLLSVSFPSLWLIYACPPPPPLPPLSISLATPLFPSPLLHSTSFCRFPHLGVSKYKQQNSAFPVTGFTIRRPFTMAFLL